MTQPNRSILTRDTEGGSATRHGLIAFIATQLVARTAIHYGIPLPPEVVAGAGELLVDAISAGAGVLAAGAGWVWRRVSLSLESV